MQALQTRFDLERENSKQFKENVKKQFEERQNQVSADLTITSTQSKQVPNLVSAELAPI